MAALDIVHADRIAGKLCCFDRLILKGHLTGLFGAGRFQAYLASQGVLLKNFAPYVKGVSEQLKAHAVAQAEAAGRPYIYLQGAMTKANGVTKETYVRSIAERDGLSAGLVCVLATVEPCRSFDVRGNHLTHLLEVIRRARKCLHFYSYYLDPQLGLCHVRVQGWFPFEVQVWANGHYALAKALDARGIGYRLEGNAFTRIDDLPAAQRLADSLATRRWPGLLTALAARVNPMLAVIGAAGFGGYYWVVDQAEVATDLIFHSRASLAEITSEVLDHASTAFGSEDVLRFLGRGPHPALAAEVGTSTRRREEGWRVKHRMARNSIKVYLRHEALWHIPYEVGRDWRVIPGSNGLPGLERERGQQPAIDPALAPRRMGRGVGGPV
ncbi:MAG: hypothetical protein ACYDB7_15565 [Mycobacteriales bacterium]